jgi:dimethylhistidine N-methyltransferase
MRPGIAHALAPRSPRLTFRQDVICGLSKRKKALPSKYFYDTRGSRLYEEICELEEYYPTRTELAILRAYAHEIGALIGPRARIVELGSGSANKTGALLAGLLEPVQYVLVDISKEPLLASAERMRATYPGLDVHALCADYTLGLDLPKAGIAARTVAYFPGSSIGNLAPSEARDLLARIHRAIGPTGAMVLGVDMPKDPGLLQAAYNDGRGVTAEFNKNLLHRMNRELFARFDVDAFWHHAFYDPKEARVEMHLVSSARQIVDVAGRAFAFDEGESITTEHSYKYSPERVARFAQSAGFTVERLWTDSRRWFGVHFLK